MTRPNLQLMSHRRQPLAELVRRHPAFDILRRAKIAKDERRRWTRLQAGLPDVTSHDIQVVFIGKTGYGKSTMVNAFFGQRILETDDVCSCTREGQCLEFAIGPGHYLSFSDLPGIGESAVRDAEYLDLYRQVLAKSDAIVYLLRADARDYAVDETAFAALFSKPAWRRRLVVALNGCDKLGPVNYTLPFVPSLEQEQLIQEKAASVERMFSLDNPAVPCSAEANWNLQALGQAILKVIGQADGIRLG